MRNVRPVVVAALTLAACGGGAGSPDAGPRDAQAPDARRGPTFVGMLKGRITSAGLPVEDAIVRFGGRPETALSSADGAFTLVVAEPPVPLDELALTAGKPGYWNTGRQVEDPAAEQELALTALELVDNPSYEFKSPDAFPAAPYCVHCHPHQVAPWSTSAHSRAARDPYVHDLYNGTAAFAARDQCEEHGGAWRTGKILGETASTSKCYVEGGVLPDLNPWICGGDDQPTCDDPNAPPDAVPVDTGPCADCHAPATTGHLAGATDLNRVAGTAFTAGVHCDFCHKIRAVTVNTLPGVAGAIELVRPGPPGPFGFSQPEVMFGPYSDVNVVVMGASLQPQFSVSELCSACHLWSQAGFRPGDRALVDPVKWPLGLPIQGTYNEWADSPAAAVGYECQSCHMPAAPFETATIDLDGVAPWPSGTRGWPRPYGTVRDHGFLARQPPAAPGYVTGPGDPTRDSLRHPLAVEVAAHRVGAAVEVTVRVANEGAGHSLPTGEPTRQLVLLVQARAGSAALAAVGGHTVPPWGGAILDGILGAGQAILAGNRLTLADGRAWPAAVGPGATIRFARTTGGYDDYPATGWFGAAGRTATEKGLELLEPAGEARVVSVTGAVATLDRALDLPEGTIFLAGQPASTAALEVDDEVPSLALAGAPGYVFAKVMVDRDGLPAPFFRAVDITVDNRLPAGAENVTTHRFDATGTGASEVTVTATLFYRRFDLALATSRGWAAIDQVRGRWTVGVPPGP